MGFLQNLFTPRGTNALQGSVNRQTELGNLLRGWGEQTWGQAQPWRTNLENTVTNTYAPMMQGLSAVMQGNAPATGQYSWYNVSKNPFDTATIGQDVFKEAMTTSNQTLEDQYAALLASLASSNARRGLTGTSFAPGGRAALSIARGQQGARQMFEAGQAGRQATAQSFNIDEQLRKEALNNWLTGKSTLQEYMQVLAALGDTSGATGMIGSAANLYGGAGQSAAQLGQSQAAMWAPLLGLGGYGLTKAFAKPTVRSGGSGEATAWPP